MVSEFPQRRGYAKGAACRAALEWAAIRLGASRGLERASVEAVADAAGVTKGAAYWHYPNKAALVRASAERALEAWTTDLLAGVLGHRTAGDRIQAVISGHLAHLQRPASPGLFLARLLLSDPDAGPTLRAWRGRVRQLVGAAVPSRDPADRGEHHRAHGLLTGLIGLCVQWGAAPDRQAMEMAAAGLATALSAQVPENNPVTNPYESVLF